MDEYISVTWLPKKYDLDNEIANFIDSRMSIYESDPLGKPIFETSRSTMFASNVAKRADYFVKHEGVFGSYIAFHCDENTVILGQHFTDVSRANFLQCLEKIEKSWSCRAL